MQIDRVKNAPDLVKRIEYERKDGQRKPVRIVYSSASLCLEAVEELVKEKDRPSAAGRGRPDPVSKGKDALDAREE